MRAVSAGWFVLGAALPLAAFRPWLGQDGLLERGPMPEMPECVATPAA
ncbi:hypothetical protein QE400_004228 [Xanthomonas sacchari]|nr:hypothetical protein [Xanthomonas sacchari]